MFISRLKSLLFASLSFYLSSMPLQVKAAEKINFVYSPLKFSLSVESLELFVDTGEINGELKSYSSFLDEKSLVQIRNFLGKSYDFNQVTLYKIGRTSLAQDFLTQLGKVVSTHYDHNGFYAIRGSVLTAAGKNDSWTIIDVLQEFPTSEIYVSLEGLLQLKNQLLFYDNYRDVIVKAIETQANQQAEKENNIDFSTLTDLRNPGKYSFNQRTIELKREQYRLTQDGFVNEYSFDVDFYVPNNIQEPSPVIFISHGFGSVRQNFTTLAEHLASHGFIVAIPEHIGSDLRYRQELLKGQLSSALSPVEYLDRPRDISFIIDKLEELVKEDPQWSQIINLQQIGVIGDSLGGTTVLSLAGAPLNIPRLKKECQRDNVIVNVSLILQCQASNLPSLEYNLKDDRIKAVIASHPMSSAIFGPESMAKIKVPLLMSAGSNDITTPVVIDQLHPFMWLENPNKHLLLYQPGTHFSSSKPSPEYTLESLPQFLVGNNRDITSRYFQGAAVAFMKVYLQEDQDYLPYLSASYGNFISPENELLNISQIEELTEEKIINAYGEKLPFPIKPNQLTTESKRENKRSIIEEIQQTGVLKVAYPRNKEPFGYIDSNNHWQGFCSFYTEQLANYLEQKLDLPSKLKTVVLPSNLDNRFDLVANKQVHLECGPNTIVDNHHQVNFSYPFFVTGTYFLIPKTATNDFNPNLSLANDKIGVQKNTSTASFLQEKYPEANAIYFEGIEGLENAIKALNNKDINAIIDDGILLENKLNNEPFLAENYQIVPKLPLTCDFYGMILPQDDRQWNNLINEFINQESLTNKYFDSKTYTKLNEYVNYCLN